MATEFDADSVSAPRMVTMVRGADGYGFNLHGEKNTYGQTISAVDSGGQAERGGLRVGDKVIEVNGMNVEACSHNEVVKRIKMNENEVSMLVIDPITEAYLRKKERPITADMANLMTVYQQEEVKSEAKDAEPEESVQTPVVPSDKPEETNVVEAAPPQNEDTTQADACDASAEVASDTTIPEEVKQLNELLNNEQAKEEPASQPEPAPMMDNGTMETPKPQPAMELPSKPASKPLRSTIKQKKTESWDEKYKKFQQL